MAPRLIARRGDDASRPDPPDRDGNPDEVRVGETLYLDEERIHVDVEDGLGERCHGLTVPGSLPHMQTPDRTVSLVRHGEVLNPERIVYADLAGFPLSQNGRRQVEDAAVRLPMHATVVSSPLERAVETAEIISGARDGRLIVDEALTEWGLSTRWAGHVWGELDADFPGELEAYLTHPVYLPFSPESVADLAARVGDAVVRHRSETSGPLILVSHQDPIQAARLRLTGRPLADLNTDKPQHAGVVELDPSPALPWMERAMWAPDQDPT